MFNFVHVLNLLKVLQFKSPDVLTIDRIRFNPNLVILAQLILCGG